MVLWGELFYAFAYFLFTYGKLDLTNYMVEFLPAGQNHDIVC